MHCRLPLHLPSARVEQFQSGIAEHDPIVLDAVAAVGRHQRQEPIAFAEGNYEGKRAVGPVDLPPPKTRLTVDKHADVSVDGRARRGFRLGTARYTDKSDHLPTGIRPPDCLQIERYALVRVQK